MSLDKVLHRAIPLISSVANFVLGESRVFKKSQIEKKGFNDLVSYVDKQAEALLVEGLSKILPDSGFITEEGTSDKKGEAYYWIIDPLDGTTNFTHGLPVYAISVALMKNDQIVMGIVHEINRDECFHAIKGQGAFCNDLPIHVSKVSTLSDSLLATGFPYYNFEQMSHYLNILNHFMRHTHGLRRMGSAAVDLAYVACGRFEGFFEYNLNAWDVAAGAFIVQEAGGIVTDFKGGDQFVFGREIVAGCTMQSEILQVIRKYWKGR